MTQNNAKGLILDTELGGDISGTLISSTVIGLQGTHVASSAPANNYNLQYIASDYNEWMPLANGTIVYLQFGGPSSIRGGSLELRPSETIVIGSIDDGTNEIIGSHYALTADSLSTVLLERPAGGPDTSSFNITGFVAFLGLMYGGGGHLTIQPYSTPLPQLNGSTASVNHSNAGSILVCYDGINYVEIGNFT